MDHICVYLEQHQIYIERPSADAADPNPERVAWPCVATHLPLQEASDGTDNHLVLWDIRPHGQTQSSAVRCDIYIIYIHKYLYTCI